MEKNTEKFMETFEVLLEVALLPIKVLAVLINCSLGLVMVALILVILAVFCGLPTYVLTLF